MTAPYPLWVAITAQSLRPTFAAPVEIDFEKFPPRPYETADPGVYRLVQSVVSTGIAPEAMEMAADLVTRGEALAVLTTKGRRALDFEPPGYAFGSTLEKWRRWLAETIETEPPFLTDLVMRGGADHWHLRGASTALHHFFGNISSAGEYVLNDDQIRRYVAWSVAEERFRESPAGNRYDPQFGEAVEQYWYPTPLQKEWLRLNDLLPGVIAALPR